MNKAVNDKKGTTYYRRIHQKGWEMAGKTGTSQVISKREDELTEEEQEINSYKNHSLFTAFAPVHDPKYAAAVVVEHGGSGSVAAAPIARDILTEAQKLNII